jgi:hypothetical protein
MNKQFDIKKLANICSNINEPEEPRMNTTFYSVNMHGYETKEDFIIPKNTRVIMFCYSGKILNMCPTFEKFVWEKINTNKYATFNYCTFLANIAQYSSIRNHFCVYNEGDKIKNIEFETSDNDFRDGIYKLPVRGGVYVEKDNKIYTTDSTSTFKILTEPQFLQRYTKNVSKNLEKASSSMRNLNNKFILLSPKLIGIYNLSLLLNNLSTTGATILLFTCREGKTDRSIIQHKIHTELEKIYYQYVNNK